MGPSVGYALTVTLTEEHGVKEGDSEGVQLAAAEGDDNAEAVHREDALTLPLTEPESGSVALARGDGEEDGEDAPVVDTLALPVPALGEAAAESEGAFVLAGEGEMLPLADCDAQGEPVREGAALPEGLAVEEAEGHADAEEDAHDDASADADGDRLPRGDAEKVGELEGDGDGDTGGECVWDCDGLPLALGKNDADGVAAPLNDALAEALARGESEGARESDGELDGEGGGKRD